MLKRTVLHPISILAYYLVAAFIIELMFTSYLLKEREPELKQRIEVTATVENASAVHRVQKHSGTKKRNGILNCRYYQDFNVTYTYKGKEYTKEYIDCLTASKAPLKTPKGYTNNQKIKIYINAFNLSDAKIENELVLEYKIEVAEARVKLLIVLIVILIPKSKWKEQKSKGDNEIC